MQPFSSRFAPPFLTLTRPPPLLAPLAGQWSHVLTWDLWVGRWIWLDGMKRGVFTPHSVLLTNLIGPPGLLLHVATGIVQGKGFPTEGKE